MDMGGRIRMTTGTAMPTSLQLMTLAQWLSPAFPVGAFAYAHGLEWAVEAGGVTDGISFERWLRDVLEFGAGASDAILLTTAYREDQSLAELDALALALSPSAERRLETEQLGTAFARTAAGVWGHDIDAKAYPIVVGAAARAEALPLDAVLPMYLHAFAANLTSAAIRLVPLGQTEGQAILARATDLCASPAKTATAQSINDLGTFSFLADIASMKHETQYSRLFRS